MQYEFYIDVFFLIDFYFNLLSLFLTAACIHRTCSVVRLCLAAAAGSFWNCILILFPILPFGVELLVTITVIGGVMLKIVFCGISADGISQLLKAEVCLFLSAGLVNGCYSFVCQQFFLETGEGLIAAGLVCVLLERFLRQWMLKRERIGKDRYH
ncbi:MAG: sigma-E processing peptidase SpoIIGA, partial [Lachnospiraceae bacterium]|nr:sigma-E processing peptidase SpoIIGA [Lachnospiraceae bacterium]